MPTVFGATRDHDMGLYYAPSRRQVLKRFRVWKEKWQVEEKRAVRCMECEHLLSLFREVYFPLVADLNKAKVSVRKAYRGF